MSPRHSTPQCGFTLLETVVAMMITLVVASGMASVYTASMRATGANNSSVQLLTSARAKIEQLQSIPYAQVGTRNTNGTNSGPGYFVYDPIYEPVYDATKGDVLLSDTVTLNDGITTVTRDVTVTAVDDATDGTGLNDNDALLDPNTNTPIDYKLVSVTATLNRAGIRYRQTLSTIIRGELPEEVDASTGQDGDGSDPPKLKKAKKVAKPAPPPPDGCDVKDPKPKKTPGKKGAAPQTGC